MFMNPVLPLEHFVPDSEARVMPDGRLYVYGSYDISGNMAYCSSVLHVFSTDNLVDWVDHGVSFSSKDIPWTSVESLLYAPDCIHRDGKYYLYFCLSDNTEGVAVSENPYGPFKNPVSIEHASGDGIDPAIFLDDDGQAYYYWGQFALRGAKMNSDMKTLDASSINRNIIDEKRHGFHEGASVRKHNGIYYLVYTSIIRGKATCLAYATSESPLGPFSYRGVIIDNVGVDPDTWNNHGSIECFHGKWYVFYHRSSQNSNFNRRLCIEPIEFLEDGTIPEVFPTTQGTEKPISAACVLHASRACRLGGWGSNACIAPDPKSIVPEVIKDVCGNGWAAYRYIEFNDRLTHVTVGYESEGEGELEIWTGDKCIAAFRLPSTNNQIGSVTVSIHPVSGVFTLFLEWRFKKDSSAILRTVQFGD